MGPQPRPGVLLDRDGVLNDVLIRDGKGYPPPSAAALRIYPEAPSALAALRGAGLPIVVVTNQPDVGRGKQTREAVDAIHALLRQRLPIDAIEACFHAQDAGCGCRKPGTRMLHAAAARFGLDLRRSFLVGDRWSDIEAGRRVGCTTFWIDRGYREPAPEHPDHVVRDVGEAARIIVRQLDASTHASGSGDVLESSSHLEHEKGISTCDAS